MTKANLPATLMNSISAMEQVTQKIDSASGDFNYLKLSKAGEWLFGADDDEVNENSLFAVATDSFVTGWQAWDDGELTGEEIQALEEGAIPRSELPEVDGDWKPLIGFNLLGIEGADEGVQLMYKTTSKGGIKAVNALMKTIVAHAQSGTHNGALIPVIALSTDHYKHKKYGKIFTPVLKVLEWENALDFGVDEPVAVEPEPVVEPEPTPEPARRRRRV